MNYARYDSMVTTTSDLCFILGNLITSWFRFSHVDNMILKQYVTSKSFPAKEVT